MTGYGPQATAMLGHLCSCVAGSCGLPSVVILLEGRDARIVAGSGPLPEVPRDVLGWLVNSAPVSLPDTAEGAWWSEVGGGLTLDGVPVRSVFTVGFGPRSGAGIGVVCALDTRVRARLTSDEHARLVALADAAAMAVADRPAAAGLFAATSELLFATDRRGRIEAASPSWHRELGMDTTRLEGQPLASVVHPDDRFVVERVFAGSRTTSRWSFDARLPTRLGQWRHYHWTADRDVSTGAVYGIARDVTARRTASAEVEQDRERLALAQDIAGLATWEWTVGRDEVVWSDGLAALHGVPADRTPDTLGGFLTFVHPEDRQAIRDAVERALESGEGYRVEYRTDPAAGPVRWLAANGRVSVDGGGQPSRIIGTAMEITELRRAEQVLAETNATLEARVASRTEQLRRAYASLEAANRVKADFVAAASHEMRTPLTLISGATELLRQRWPQLDDDARLTHLDMVHRHARRLDRLVHNLLIASRVESEAATARLETVALPAVVTRAVEGSARTSPVTVDVPDVEILADAQLLEAIIGNLLDNAQVYGRPPYQITAEITVDEIVVEVIDHGDGVPPHFLPKLFDRFTQASTGERRTARGLGLGLWLARGMAHMQGGKLEHHPTDPTGATFTLRLPQHDEHPASPRVGRTPAYAATLVTGGSSDGRNAHSLRMR